MLAIIGGSGLSQLASISNTRREVVRTPYGDPSGPLTFGKLGGVDVAFLARHGYGHTIAPHEINYRANLWALRQVGVNEIIAVATVGGIRSDLLAGKLLLPNQIIDYTWGRESTFFEGADQPVTHIDFTHPYDEALRKRLAKAASDAGLSLDLTGTYGCTQGPRLETAAEIQRMARDGCDIVGMTGMPEAALARELDIPYAAIGVVANAAAGVGQSANSISLDAITQVLDDAMRRVGQILLKLPGI
jgi:5'-deoxy-5'-methylthioadenosine phosphorylase